MAAQQAVGGPESPHLVSCAFRDVVVVIPPTFFVGRKEGPECSAGSTATCFHLTANQRMLPELESAC